MNKTNKLLIFFYKSIDEPLFIF